MSRWRFAETPIPGDLKSDPQNTPDQRQNLTVPAGIVGIYRNPELLGVLEHISQNLDIATQLKSIGPAGRVRQVTLSDQGAVEIIPANKKNTGFFLCVPEIVAVESVIGVALTSGTTFAFGDFDLSTASKLSAYLILAASSLGALSVDLQALDIVGGSVFTTQGDLFSGAVANGNYFASIVNGFGLEEISRFLFNPSGGGTAAASLRIKANLKPRVFIGDSSVTVNTGFCVSPNTLIPVYFYNNAPLYAITTGSPLGHVSVYELQ